MALALAVVGGLAWFVLTDDLPDVDGVAAWRPEEPVELVDRAGEVVATLGVERARWVPLADIAPVVRDAFVVAEDGRFAEHGGVDFGAWVRAGAANVRAGRVVQGGSTITQQVVRLVLVGDRERTAVRKLREAVLARRLETVLGKREILELYLNAVYLGENCTGVEAAARAYFGRGAGELGLAEAATLATLPPRPSLGNPRRDPEGARARRDALLARMGASGRVTTAAAAAAARGPIELAGPPPPPRGSAYLRFVERKLAFGNGRVPGYVGGLRLALGMDARLQAEAEAVVAATAARLSRPGEPAVQGAFFAVDTVRGELLALVGGADGGGEFDRATQARRPVGSTFKPIVYLAGIDSRRVTAADLFDDGPLEVALPEGGTWRPENYGGVQAGTMTVAQALATSNNRVLVRTMLRLDPGLAADRVYGFARRLGLGGDPVRAGQPDLGQRLCPKPEGGRRCGYALGLGAADLTLAEVVRAYSIFATGGLLLEPRAVLGATDRGGARVAVPRPVAPVDPQRVVEHDVAAVGQWLLRQVVERGTAARARDFAVPVLGKTGTSDEAHDVWFVGATPSVVAGIWFGADTPRSLGPAATGGNTALPAWLEIMAAAPVTRAAFPPMPADLVWTGGAPGQGEPLLAGTTPAPAEGGGAARPWWLGDLPVPEGFYAER